MDKLHTIIVLLGFLMFFIPSEYLRPTGKIIAFLAIIGIALPLFGLGKKEDDKDDEDDEE